MPADPDFAEVFISHSSADTSRALAVANLLCTYLSIPKDEIICTSAEPFRLPTGSTYERDIVKAIGKCSLFIFLASSASLKSFFCAMELGAAWGRRKKIIPVLLPGSDAASLERPLSSMNISPWQSRETWTHVLEVAETESGADRVKARSWAEAARALAESAA